MVEARRHHRTALDNIRPTTRFIRLRLRASQFTRLRPDVDIISDIILWKYP
jgi:hypothetical protein